MNSQGAWHTHAWKHQIQEGLSLLMQAHGNDEEFWEDLREDVAFDIGKPVQEVTAEA